MSITVRRIALVLAIGFASLCMVGVIGVPIAVKRTHDAYGTWSIWPGAAGRRTPKLTFLDRHYLLSVDPSTLPSDVVPLGAAPGDGEVYSRRPPEGIAPTVLFVRYPDQTVAGYALSGGP